MTNKRIIMAVFATVVFTIAFLTWRGAARADSSVVNDSYISELDTLAGYGTFGDLISDIIDGGHPNPRGILQNLISFIAGDIRTAAAYSSAIVAVAVMSACIGGAGSGFLQKNGETAFLICYCIAAAFSVGVLKNAAESAVQCVERISAFVKMTVPAYIGFVTATGAVGAAGTRTVFLIMVNIVTAFAGNVMPGVFFNIGIMYAVNYMSGEIHVVRLVELVRQVMFWILGLLLTVFAGSVGLSGINAGAGNMSVKALKYTVGRCVPVIGGFLAESTDVLAASAAIFRSAFGTAGIIILFSMCLLPVAKLFVMGVSLKAAAGIAEPFCDSRISDCAAGIGQTIIDITLCIVLVSVMLMLAVAVLILTAAGG